MIKIRVCIGSSCHLRGSYNVIQTFQHLIEENLLYDKVDFKGAFCMKGCDQHGVTVMVDDESYKVVPENAINFFKTTIMDKIRVPKL